MVDQNEEHDGITTGAAIAATMAAFTQMISASVFRAVNADGLRCIPTNRTNKGTGVHLILSRALGWRWLLADHTPAALRLFIGHPEILLLGLG